MIYLLTGLLFLNGVSMLISLATGKRGASVECGKSLSSKALIASCILLLLAAVVALACRVLHLGTELDLGLRLGMAVLGPGLSLLATLTMLVTETPDMYALNLRRVGRFSAAVGMAFVWLMMLVVLAAVYSWLVPLPYGLRELDAVTNNWVYTVCLYVVAAVLLLGRGMSWIRPLRTTDAP